MAMSPFSKSTMRLIVFPACKENPIIILPESMISVISVVPGLLSIP